MRRVTLLLLLAASACGRHAAVERAPDAAASAVLTARCEGPAVTPARLPLIRTVPQLLADRDAQDKARQTNAARLELCQDKLRQTQTWARQELERVARAAVLEGRR